MTRWDGWPRDLEDMRVRLRDNVEEKLRYDSRKQRADQQHFPMI